MNFSQILGKKGGAAYIQVRLVVRKIRYWQFIRCNGLRSLVSQLGSDVHFNTVNSEHKIYLCNINAKTLPCAHCVGRIAVHSTFSLVTWFHSRQTWAHRQMSRTDNLPKMFNSSSLGRHWTVLPTVTEVSTASVTVCSSSLSDATNNQVRQNIILMLIWTKQNAVTHLIS